MNIGKKFLVISLLGMLSISNVFAKEVKKEVYCDEIDQVAKIGFTMALGAVAGPVGVVLGMPLGALAHEWECKDYFEKKVKKFNTEKKVVAYFEHNSDKISILMNEELDLLDNNAIKSIDVVGHTSKKGSAAYNLDLGFKRAMSVANYIFKNKNIDPGKLVIYSKGEEIPSKEDTEELNRRVEIYITYKKDYIL